MLCALAVAVLTASDQPGPVVVLVASKRAGADAYAAKVAAKVHSTLLSNSTMPASDDVAGSKLLKKAGGEVRSCQGATECLVKAAQQLGPRAIIIGVDVGKIAKTLAVHLEAVSADSKEPLAIADFSAPAEAWLEAAGEPITAFVKQVIDKSATPAIPDKVAKTDDIKRPADAPQEASLTPPPAPEPTPGQTATRSSGGGGKLVPIVTLGVAAAALIASGVLLGLAMNEKGIVDRSLSSDGMNTELSKAEFDQRRTRGNMYFTVSLSTALVGVLLGATGGVLFAL